MSEDEGTSGFPEIVTAEKYVIDHHLGGVISQSFSATEETFPTRQSLLNLRGAYTDAAAKGVTVLAASGDSGAADVRADGSTYYLHPVTSWPDSDPLVTGIGGTQLHLDATGRHTAADSVWNDTYDVATQQYIFGEAGPNPLAGGGGMSTIFQRPAYQHGVRAVVGKSARRAGHLDERRLQRGGEHSTRACREARKLGTDMWDERGDAAVRGHRGAGRSGRRPPARADQPGALRLVASGRPGVVDVTKGNTTVSFEQGGALHTVVGGTARPGYDIASGVGTIDARWFVPELARLS